MILYEDIFKFDIILMNAILKTYKENNKAWKIFNQFYKDPDNYPISKEGFKTKDGIKCTVDGLISINRIYEYEGFNKKFIDTFYKYRKIPIIFFPSEKNGINTSRYNKFGDRIDYTLFDLKRYCDGKECKLKSSYELPKTQKWLKSFNYNFEDIIKWMKIDTIFVDNNNNIFDLDKNNKTIISKYYEQYSKKWELNYYENLKVKIDEFIKTKQ